MARKQRRDSVAGAVQVVANSKQVQPPSNVPLQDHHLPFFASVIETRASTDWIEQDLEVAALLARDMFMAEQEGRLLEQEGCIIATAGGNAAKNPREAILHGAYSRIRGYRKDLMPKGDPRDQARRNKLGKDIEDKAQAKGLLAGAVH